MAKIFDPGKYVYCEKHDIFYDKQRNIRAEEENKKLKKEGYNLVIHGCPLCAEETAMKIINSIISSRRMRERKRILKWKSVGK